MGSDMGSEPPFPPSHALNRDCLRADRQTGCSCGGQNMARAYLPGDPAIGLNPDEVYGHLSAQLHTPLLDELYGRLWLVARKSGDHINALHVQTVKRRSIVPVEDPRLHLVWSNDKIYFKPVPECLLNHDFWAIYLHRPCSNVNAGCAPDAPSFDRSVAMGFLRSYSRLVPQRLDFTIAQESHLIPSEITWLQWAHFIHHFRQLGDDQVAKRYHYGQLRLSRLNWLVRFCNPIEAQTRWFYEIPHWSISGFVTEATIPFIFLFGSMSVVLSAMQVCLSVPSEVLWSPDLREYGLQTIGRAFLVFSILILVLLAVCFSLFTAIPLAGLVWQLQWGYRHRGKPNDKLAGRA